MPVNVRQYPSDEIVKIHIVRNTFFIRRQLVVVSVESRLPVDLYGRQRIRISVRQRSVICRFVEINNYIKCVTFVSEAYARRALRRDVYRKHPDPDFPKAIRDILCELHLLRILARVLGKDLKPEHVRFYAVGAVSYAVQNLADVLVSAPSCHCLQHGGFG